MGHEPGMDGGEMQRLWFHCYPAKLEAFGPMGAWVTRWPGQRELIPNIKGDANGLKQAFKSCLGTEPFWVRDGYGFNACNVCGIEMPPIIEACDHPFTRQVFAFGREGNDEQEVGAGGAVSMVYGRDGEGE